MPKVSIIIPVYNSGSFLDRCLGSLKAQTLADWEAICVDDGSTDESGRILDRHAGEDSRIKVLHRKNAGVSEARNAALESACGEYVAFLDSDDFLHPQTLGICTYVAERDGSDMVAYTYDRRYRTRMIIRHLFGLPDPKKVRFRQYDIHGTGGVVTGNIFDWVTEYSGGEIPGGDKAMAVKHCQPWRCLYRREAVSGIRFISGIIYEDFPWWGEVLLNISRASIINLPLYYYYPNRRSYIMSSRQEFRIESLKKAIAAAERVYTHASPEQKEIWEKNFLVPFRDKLEKKLRRYRNG